MIDQMEIAITKQWYITHIKNSLQLNKYEKSQNLHSIIIQKKMFINRKSLENIIVLDNITCNTYMKNKTSNKHYYNKNSWIMINPETCIS